MKKGIIVASFGTTHKDTRVKTIENIEKKISKTFTDYHVMRAFTSRMVIGKIKKNEDIHIFNEKEALLQMESLGIEKKDVYIQPLHIIPGIEYEKLLKLEDVHVAKPLLFDENTIDEVIDHMGFSLKPEEAMILFGHGTRHRSDAIYALFNERLQKKGHERVFMITAEGELDLEGLLPILKEKQFSHIYLQPFMIVAGDHAKNDMASDDEDSLKSILMAHGFDVTPIVKGLGEYDFIGDMFIERCRNCIEGERNNE